MPDLVRPFDHHADDPPLASNKRIRDRCTFHATRFDQPSDPSSVWSALWRGMKNRCPACGGAKLFAKFVKPVELCPTCSEDWTRHSADDLPPYIVILVIGHVVVTGMTIMQTAFDPPMWLQVAIWFPTIILLAIGLIQPAKGFVIALQWWHRMGEFEQRRSSIASLIADGPILVPPDRLTIGNPRRGRALARRRKPQSNGHANARAHCSANPILPRSRDELSR